MKSFRIIFTLLSLAILFSCSSSAKMAGNGSERVEAAVLTDSLRAITTRYPGEIGIALICGMDTVVVNNEDKYPLMSVFKLHQAIALCHSLEQKGRSIDTILHISRSDLNPDTWSPMLKDYKAGNFALPVSQLLRYTLMQSDNNASNLLFERLENVAETDSFIATLIPRNSFRLTVTEAQMWSDHELCYQNHSSPLGAAILINRLFTDSIIESSDQEFIRAALRECKTGTDRIAAPLMGKDGVVVAHKTGSGFRNDAGVLSAHNDVAFVSLPDGRRYALAVFVKDFNGDEKTAARAIAEISAAVYSFIEKQ